MKIESNHNTFSIPVFMQARSLALQLIDDFAQWAENGITEKQGSEWVDQRARELGFEKKWHPNKVRFGRNTLKSFRDPSEEGILFDRNDLFFIDIGFVFQGHENDIGRTLLLETNKSSEEYQKLIDASQLVFDQTHTAWQEQSLSGIELYQFADNSARELGFELNQRMKGHRLGSFPHHVHYKGGLNEVDIIPADGLWILEIHLIDKNNSRGAFFEDLLKIN